MKKITLRIVTPDELIYEGTVNRVRACGEDGYFTILPSHAPMLASLATGELQIEGMDQKTFYVVIDAGVLEVADNHVNVLTQAAMVAKESDLAVVRMEFEQQNRQERNAKSREQMIKSEMELHRLLHQANNF